MNMSIKKDRKTTGKQSIVLISLQIACILCLMKMIRSNSRFYNFMHPKTGR